MHAILKEHFQIIKYKKDPSFYENAYRFYENELVLKYQNMEIGLDLHVSFIQKAKFPVDYALLLKNNRPEHHFISLVIQISNDYFMQVEQKFLDLYLMLKKENLDWNYILKLINQFQIRKITYLTCYILNHELGCKTPLESIKLKKHQKWLLHHMFMTENFRINQLALFFYTFDSVKDYKRFLQDKYVKIKHNGIKEVVKSLKKIK